METNSTWYISFFSKQKKESMLKSNITTLKVLFTQAASRIIWNKYVLRTCKKKKKIFIEINLYCIGCPGNLAKDCGQS